MSSGHEAIHPLLGDTKAIADGRTHQNWATYGLTKREWYAGLSLSAMPTTFFNPGANPSNAAAAAVRLADALLEELGKE